MTKSKMTGTIVGNDLEGMSGGILGSTVNETQHGKHRWSKKGLKWTGRYWKKKIQREKEGREGFKALSICVVNHVTRVWCSWSSDVPNCQTRLTRLVRFGTRWDQIYQILTEHVADIAVLRPPKCLSPQGKGNSTSDRQPAHANSGQPWILASKFGLN